MLRRSGGGLGLLGRGFGRSSGVSCDVEVCDIDWEGTKMDGEGVCGQERGGRFGGGGSEVHLLNHRLKQLLSQKHSPRASTP